MHQFLNKDKIDNLKQMVIDQLSPYINRDFVLLDVPNHRNVGDTLIWQGELEYLSKLNLKMKYSSNIYTNDISRIGKGDIILLHGGGNFGDVWQLNQKFRNEIISSFPNNRIIIFPQTIFYNDANSLSRDREIYNRHKDLIICARDNISFEIASSNFVDCKILMLPDMAFFNDFTSFHDSSSGFLKTLFMLRQDKEMGDVDLFAKIKNELQKTNTYYEVKDWPDFYPRGSFKSNLQKKINSAEIRLSKRLMNSSFKFLVDDLHGLKRKDYKEYRLKKGIEFMNQYDEIYSTRLHGFILGILLNKKVNIFDNSYGKNKNFFNTWLKDFYNVTFISS